MNIEKMVEALDEIAYEISTKMLHKITEGLNIPAGYSYILLLKYLKDKGSCNVTDVANYLNITLSGVTGLVDRLTELGIVNRTRSEEDRRVVHIELTDLGKNTLEKMRINRNNIFKKYFSGLSSSEMECFFKVTGKITAEILSDN